MNHMSRNCLLISSIGLKSYGLVTSLNYNILASGKGLLPIRQTFILTDIDWSTHPQLETDDEKNNEIRKFPFSRIFQWKGQQGLTALRLGCKHVFSKSNSAPLHKDSSASSACINVGIVNVYIHIIDHGYKNIDVDRHTSLHTCL